MSFRRSTTLAVIFMTASGFAAAETAPKDTFLGAQFLILSDVKAPSFRFNQYYSGRREKVCGIVLRVHGTITPEQLLSEFVVSVGDKMDAGKIAHAGDYDARWDEHFVTEAPKLQTPGAGTWFTISTRRGGTIAAVVDALSPDIASELIIENLTCTPPANATPDETNL